MNELRRRSAAEPEALLADLLHRQADLRPGAPALEDGQATLGYAALAGRVEALARRLAAWRLAPEEVVAVALERSADLVIAFLAVLRAGAAWLPLDPAYPPERLALMLEDAAPALLLTRGGTAAALPDTGLPRLLLDEGGAESPLPPAPGPERLAYLLYTSGSTGRPKGVLIEHRGLVNLGRAQAAAFRLAEDGRVLQFASPNFDAFVSEVAMTLAAGACLHLAPPEALLPGPPLARMLRQRGITLVTLPPSALSVMTPEELPPTLSLVVAGEACSAELVRRWAPGRRFFNAYGPTEATVCATIEACDPAEAGAPPVGRAMAGVRLLLLDEAGRPLPPGAAGEICIGGLGLARGYHQRPELTAARFVADPERPGARLYRSGDLGRLRPDGRLEFLGRIDGQVKIRGYRIEPGEIEEMLAAHPGVALAAVVPEEAAGERRLVACVVPRDPAPDAMALRSFLAERLPAWMVPARWAFLERLPLSPSGKVDRARLPPPAAAEPPGAAPRDPLEQHLLLLAGEVLGHGGLGVEDDFFAAGGDSLRAARLLARIERELGRALPLSLMVRRPSVAALTRALRAEGPAPAWSPLVELRPGEGVPLVCVHPAGGTVLPYAPLARALPDGRRFLGLQARGYDAGQVPDGSVEAMTERYLAALQEAVPTGPLALAGWSFGALVALEMTRRLQAAGRVVQLIALDAALGFDHVGEGETDIILRVVRLYGVLQRREAAGLVEAIDADPAQRMARLVEQAVAAGIFPADFDLAQARRLARLIGACFEAGRAYRPAPWDGPMTLIRASRVGIVLPDPTLGWGAVAGAGLQLVWTPGDHLSMMQPPEVAALADRLEALLTGASLAAFRQPAA